MYVVAATIIRQNDSFVGEESLVKAMADIEPFIDVKRARDAADQVDFMIFLTQAINGEDGVEIV